MIAAEITRIPVDVAAARVYEEGWQSWSPTTTYPVEATSHRPADDYTFLQHYRPGKPAGTRGFQGEGLLIVDDGRGTVHSFATNSVSQIPSITAELDGHTLRVSADGPIDTTIHSDISAAQAAFAQRIAADADVAPLRAAPTVWCSWYHYFTAVTAADVTENLAGIQQHQLPVEVIQIDDGWQRRVGDWLTLSDRFDSLRDIVFRITDAGHRAGVWVAPFLALDDSQLASRHPEWLAPGPAGFNWGRPTRGVDPLASKGYLTDVFTMLREAGFDYFKLDFLYAGALQSIDAYREGMAHIRDVVGDDSYILACGAPLLPSVGLCDAMRIGPDIAVDYEPEHGQLCKPSQRGATLNTVARCWQQGRWWINDSDSLIVRPEVEHRRQWAQTLNRYGALVSISDRIAALDEWGLEATRQWLEIPGRTAPLS